MEQSQLYQIVIVAIDENRRAELVQKLSRLSGKPTSTASAVLDRLPFRIARRQPREKAESLRDFLEHYGAQVEIRPEKEGPTASPVKRASRGGRGTTGSREPLGLISRLRWCFRLAWRNKAPELAAWVLVLVLGGLIMVGAMGLAMLAGGQQQAMPAMVAGLMKGGISVPFILVGVLVALVFALLVGWQQAALMWLPHAYFAEGESPPAGTVLRHGWRRAPDMASSVALVGVVPMLLGTLISALALKVHSSAFLVPVAFVVMVGIYAAFVLALPATAVEGIGPVEALRRGWELGKGRRLALVLNSLIFAVLAVILFVAAGLAVGLIGSGLSAVGGGWAGVVTAVVAVLIYGLLFVVVGSAGTYLPVLFYFESRVASEGWQPPWHNSPQPGWSLQPKAWQLEEERRGSAWRDFVLVNLAATGVMALVSALLPKPQLPVMPIQSGVGGNNPMVSSMPRARMESHVATHTPRRQQVREPSSFQLSVGPFFANPADPSFWIEVRAPSRPSGTVKVLVKSVLDANGVDHYAADNIFEKNPFFSQLQWNSGRDGSVEAQRTVHLKKNSGKDQLAEIHGSLSFQGREWAFVLRPDQTVTVRIGSGTSGSGQSGATAGGRDTGGTSAQSLDQLGYKAYQAGNYRQSIDYLSRSLSAHPDDAWAWYTRGWAYWKLGEQKKARDDMAHACAFKYLDSCTLKDH